MPEIIEIEGGLVRRIEKNVVAELQLADLLPHMERRMPVLLPGLPNNTKAVYATHPTPDTQTIELIIELPPAIRTLPIRDIPETQRPRVALPFSLFHFRLSAHGGTPAPMDWMFDWYRLFFAKETGANLNQTVIAALLPNVFESGEICFGNTTGRERANTLADRINLIVNNFYLTMFAEGGHTRRNYLPWNSTNWERWKAETVEHGATAWQTFPEWDPADPTQEHYQLSHVFGTDIDTKAELRPPNAIPDIPVALTFGRAEEWLHALTPVQRLRLRTAIQALEADGAEFAAEAE